MQEISGRVIVVTIPEDVYDALMSRKGKSNPDARRLFGSETNSTRTVVQDVVSYCLREFSWKEVERGIE
jgi:hypothetical protein